MQYVTTADTSTILTPDQVICSSAHFYDGYCVPNHIPQLSTDILLGNSANNTVAHVLNLLFSLQLTGRDIDLAIGKIPVRLTHMNHRISVIESWHNLDGDFKRMVKNLTARIRRSKDFEQDYNPWLTIAIRAAVICGAYTQAISQNILTSKNAFDIAIPSMDFSFAVSAWYCRQMGLPIRNIVICCNENNLLWDFFQNGVLHTRKSPVHTCTPECDKIVPEFIEILIYECGGEREAASYRKCLYEGKTYFPSDEVYSRMAKGFYVSVIGHTRMDSTISGVYRTHGYVMEPYCALSYAGAMDYRAHTGENRHIMLLCENDARFYEKYLAEALNITSEELHHILDS